MSAFTAYFDAAGKEKDQVALSVAGFLSTAEQWTKWETPWRQRLAEDGLLKFHHNELSALHANKRERLVADLSLIISEFAVFKVGVAVLNYDVQQALPIALRDQWRITSYALCARTVAKEVRIWASEWSGRMPELVYEDGDEGKGKFMGLMTSQGYPPPIFRWKDTRRNRKSGLLEAGSPPLEAADLLAYSLFSRARALWYDKLNPELRDFTRFQSNIDKIPGRYGIITPDHLRFLKDGLEQFDVDVMTTTVRIKS